MPSHLEIFSPTRESFEHGLKPTCTMTDNKNDSSSSPDEAVHKSALEFSSTFAFESGRVITIGQSAIDNQTAPEAAEHAGISIQAKLNLSAQANVSTCSDKKQPQMPTATPSLNKLPLELRTDIWKKSLPDPEYVTLYPGFGEGATIVFEQCAYRDDVWGPVSDETDDEDEVTHADRLENRPERYLPPQQMRILALLRTCKESRKVAMNAYNVQLPMSLSRTWRMDGNSDTFVPISIKNYWCRPLHHTPLSHIWNTLMRNVKHIALFNDVFNNWSDNNKAWFLAQFPGLNTLSVMFTHEYDIPYVISERYEERITTPENLWRNPQSSHRQEVITDMLKHRANLQRYRDKVDFSFKPPALIALATHSGEEYGGLPLYGQAMDEDSDGEEGAEGDEGAEYDEESDDEESAASLEL